MLTDGKFEQHAIIEDFFKKKRIEDLKVTFEVKVGGKDYIFQTCNAFRKSNFKRQCNTNKLHRRWIFGFDLRFQVK